MDKNSNCNLNFLQEELSQLEQQQTEILARLKMVRGDYKENADQQLLEKENSKLQERISFLKIKIATTKEVISKIVTYCLLETGEKVTVELNNVREPEHSKGLISPASPVGLALTNKKVGEITEVNTVKGSYKIKIISIEEK